MVENSAQVRVATICMNSGASPADNISKACDLILQAAEMGARWVLLPEMFTYMGPYEGLHGVACKGAPGFPGEILSLIRKKKLTLFGGTVPEVKSPAEIGRKKAYRKVYNTCFSFDENADLIASYRKTHLFTLHDEEGDALYGEDEGFCPGHKLTKILYDGWKIAFAICYDIRFPELFLKLSAHEAVDVLMVPSAFTEMTGRDHWICLLQARALELQCFVVAANQTGFHGEQRECYGHSLVIDPWGQVLADSGKDEGVVCADISQNRLSEIRKKLPVLRDRRRDLKTPEPLLIQEQEGAGIPG